MLETLYSFGQTIIVYYKGIVDLLASVEILGYSALDVIFGAGLGAFFAYVTIQWVIPE